MYGDGQFTARIAYAILLFGGCILAVRLLQWYTDWPW